MLIALGAFETWASVCIYYCLQFRTTLQIIIVPRVGLHKRTTSLSILFLKYGRHARADGNYGKSFNI